MAKNLSKKLWLLVMSMLWMFQFAIAQTKTVTGKVTDDKGNPLSGASVVVKGTKSGKATDESGNFSIVVSVSSKALIVSSLGFATEEINISNGTNFTIILKPAAAEGALNDVVVVGYGTARRKDVTGAVSSIASKDFNQGVIINPMDQVQGRVPGLVVVTPDGDPNSNPIIRLRGQTSLLGSQTPLIVVDGIIMDDYQILSSIPPADIISFDFLKDASAAAIYGSRGANGVILITTRKGRAGSSQIYYSGSLTVANDAKYFDLQNASSFVQNALKLGFDTSGYNWDGKSNTDWQKSITQTGFTNSQLIGISGGTENFVYNGSLTYQDQKGIVINTGRKQVGIRLNAEQKAFDGKLTIQYNVLSSQTTRKNIDANIFYWAYNIPPTVPEKLANGTDNPIYNYNYVNPVWMENNEVRHEVNNLAQYQVVANYEIIKGLKAGIGGNISRYNTQYDYFLPVIPGAGAILNQGFKYNSNTNSDKGDIHINYAKSIGKNNFTATGVYEYNYYTDNLFYARGQGFPVDLTTTDALSSGIPTYNTISSSRDEYKLISFLARATYNYDNKYYLTASLRRDGSSKFGSNHAWGNFPSVSAAWRINKENFLKDVTWIDDLKINVGYGQTGNSDPISAYNTLFLLGPNVRTYDPTNSTNPYPVGYSPIQNPNPDLKWEKRIGRNIGIEFAFLKSRITGNLSIFSDKTQDMLYYYGVPTPPNYIGSVLANVGSLTNKGWEFGLNLEVIRKKDISWTIGGQITVAHTKITSLSGDWAGNHVSTDRINIGSAGGQGLSFNPLTYIKVGQPFPVFNISHFTGIDAEGQQLLDSAGVKSLTLAQNGSPTLYYIDPTPKFTYGINTSFRYKSWTLTAAFNGNYGQKIYDNSRLNLENFPRFPGLNVKNETFTNGLKESPNTSDYWLEKASYLRLQNLTVSYTFNQIGHMSGLRVYFTGSNLFVITPYKGLDPEISPVNGGGGTRASIGSLASTLASSYGGLGGAGTGQAYIDNNYSGGGFYPRPRSFTLGITFSVK